MTPDSVFSRGRAASLLAAAGLLFPAVVSSLHAQTPGTLDTSFNTGAIGATIYALDYETDADGSVKLTVGGDRGYGEYYLATPATQPVGTRSADFFLPEFGNPARIIYTVVPEQVIADDASLHNILLGGTFGRGSSQTSAQNIVRIMPSGALDTSFVTNVGTGANTFVTAILPLADGSIVVGGQFTTFNRQTRRRIVRLRNSGSVDESFATGLNIDNDVITLAESFEQNSNGKADGRTLVGGIFNNVAGQPYGKLARLDANGNLDMSFHPNIDLRVLSILVQPDGKIIIGGDFTKVNGVAVSRIARLNYDGSLDTTFVASVTGVPNKDVNPTAVYVLKPLGDGRIYVGGEFAQINGATRRYLGLISADGILDPSFDPGTTIYDSVQAIAIQSDHNLLIGETLGPKIGKNYQPSLIRLYGVLPFTDVVSPAAQQVQSAVPKKTVHPPSVGAATRNSVRAALPYNW